MFRPDSKLNRILSAVASFMALNLLWLLCCVPLVTAGPSTVALYTVTRKLARREDPVVAQEFFRALRENFRKGLLAALILLVPMLAAGAYLLLVRSGALAGDPWMRLLCRIGIVIVGVVCSYVWPLLAWFETGLGNTLRNAVLLPLSSPVVAAMVTALNLLPLWLLVNHTQLFLTSSVFWLFIGGALLAFADTQLLRLQLRHYLPEDEFPRPGAPKERDGSDSQE